MKSQGIPEHKMNFTGEVGQSLEETAKTKHNATNKPKQSNPKDAKL